MSASSVALPRAAIPRRRRSVWREMRKQWSAYLFLAPTLLLFAVFTIGAVGYAFWLSFHQWNILEPVKPYVGLANYERLLQDGQFGRAIVNTLVYTAASVPLTMGFGLLIALLLNTKIRARGFLRTLFYLPVITPLVIAAIVWKWVYNGDYGLLNYYLLQLGLIAEPLRWLSDPALAMPAVIITTVWKGVGFAMVVYLAGLQSIPEDYYDAAKIDGADGGRRLKDITLPLLTPTTLFLAVISVLGALQVFTEIYIMTSGGPLRSTTTIVYHIYTTAFRNFDMGYAAAMAFGLFAMMFVFTLVQLRAMRSEVEY
ncbi:MAG: sugar ABC transporter permease [Chloroflexota bacterium]|nr:sugar ABC transporter permease [Chloroflexota bacterium]